MDRFRLVDQFRFSVKLRHIAECDASPRIDFIDAKIKLNLREFVFTQFRLHTKSGIFRIADCPGVIG